MVIGDRDLTLQDVSAVLSDEQKVEISPASLKNCEDSFYFVKNFSADKVIYGINTGFGPMAQHKIPYADRLSLQYNLIRSHASGSSKPIPEVFIRAMLIDRLNTFALGKSGVHPDLLLLLRDLINLNLTPVIYEHGGVGASGDLVQLAHMALAIIGEGEMLENGKIYPAREALERHHITPFAIRIREGIAMMNGTSCMTGIGLVNLLNAEKLLNHCVLISASINEVLEAFDDHISAPLNSAKHHPGQIKIAESMRRILKNSSLLKDRTEHLYKDTAETHFLDKVQEYYSLRCMPQILGPISDTIDYAAGVIVDELNSVSDNPVIDIETQNIYHGGNFHGDYVSLEMDKLRIAVAKLSMLAERQLNYLLNDKLNGKLPPFINTGVIGLNFGMQGIQYTATSTVAENQTLSAPVYIHSIPSNNDNQDVVSMGSNAALLTARVIENTYEVLAIEVLALAEAVDCLGKTGKLSPEPQKLYDSVRKITPRISSDEPKFRALASIKEFLKNGDSEVL